ncbi:MAG: hypothetical protein ACOX6Y_05880 [Christensenellales bacterium]|jgi:hypothetical protein
MALIIHKNGAVVQTFSELAAGKSIRGANAGEMIKLHIALVYNIP